EEGSVEYEASANKSLTENSPILKEYLLDNFTEEERKNFKEPKYFYNITFDKPGGLVMPIILEMTYADGTKATETYPAQVWRLYDKQVSKAIASDKEIVGFKIDPNLETADIDVSNNTWPRQAVKSEFDTFKEKGSN